MYQSIFIPNSGEFNPMNTLSHENIFSAFQRINDLKLTANDLNGKIIIKLEGDEVIFDCDNIHNLEFNPVENQAVFIHPVNNTIFERVDVDKILAPGPIDYWKCTIIDSPDYFLLLENGDILENITIDILRKRIISRISQYANDILEKISIFNGISIELQKIEKIDYKLLDGEIWKELYSFIISVRNAEMDLIKDINNIDDAEVLYERYVVGPWSLINLSERNNYNIPLPRR